MREENYLFFSLSRGSSSRKRNIYEVHSWPQTLIRGEGGKERGEGGENPFLFSLVKGSGLYRFPIFSEVREKKGGEEETD